MRCFAIHNGYLFISMLAVLLSASARPVASDEYVPLVFPVAVSEAQPVSQSQERDKTLLSQKLSPISAVRIEADFAVRFQSSRGQLISPTGPNWDFVVPVGTVFIGAISKGAMYFCASKTLKDTYFEHYDMGICLRDQDADGTFEQQILVDDGIHRIRNPFEIKTIEGRESYPVSIRYTKLPEGEVPSVELRIRYEYKGNFLVKAPFLTMGICWPPSLPIPTEGVTRVVLCATTDWAVEGANHVPFDLTTYRITGNNKSGEVVWGPLSIKYTLDGDHVMAATVRPMASGPAAILNRGWVMVGNDTRDERAILRLQPLVPGQLQKGLTPPI